MSRGTNVTLQKHWSISDSDCVGADPWVREDSMEHCTEYEVADYVCEGESRKTE